MKSLLFIVVFLTGVSNWLQAQIVNVSYTNHTAYLNQGAKGVDIDNDGTYDMIFESETIYVMNHVTQDVLFMSTPNQTVACTSPVPMGSLISPVLMYQYYNYSSSGPYAQGNIYVPFRFQSGAGTFLGYFNFDVTGTTITLNYYAYQSNPGQSIYAGEVSDKVCSFLSVENIPNNCNGSDLKLNYHFPVDTALITEYRAFIVNVDNANGFSVFQALLLPDSLCTIFSPNAPDSILFTENSRSVDGSLIDIVSTYRIYILSKLFDGSAYLSNPTSGFELACTARPATNILISDVGDAGNASDIFLEFDMQDAFCVSQVKPIIAFSTTNLTLSDVYEMDNQMYPNIPVTSGINSLRFPADAVDHYGALIESNYTYRVFLVSIPLVGCKDSSISAPSNLLLTEICNPLPYVIGDSSSTLDTYIIDTLLSYNVPLNAVSSLNLDLNSDGTYDFVFYYKRYQGTSMITTLVSIAGQAGLIKCDLSENYALPFEIGDSICNYLYFEAPTTKTFYKIIEGSINDFLGSPIGYAYVVKIWDSGTYKIGWIHLSESAEGLRIHSLTLPIGTSVPEVELNHQARVFPNPASRQIHLMTIEDIPYKIINTMGRIVQSGNVKDKLINIEGMSPGIYILQTVENEEIFNTKVVIE